MNSQLLGLSRAISVGVLALCVASPSAWGQEQDPAGPQTTPPSAPPPVVVDPAIEAIKSMMVGTWKATSVEYNADADETGGTIWMNVAPIRVDGLDNTLYIERAWDTHRHRPFGQTIAQLYRFRGEMRMRTLEFRLGVDRSNVFSGLWAAPDVMPSVSVGELIGTLDFVVTESDGTVTAATPYPYPTAFAGACQLESEFSVTADTMRSMDKGIAPDGSAAWSSNDGSGYFWRRAEMNVRVKTDEDGFVMIEYAGWDSPEAGPGDQAFVDHVGQTGQGVVFWSAVMNQTLAQLTLPIENTPIEGLTRTLADIREGTVRRTVVPASLGYGEVATPQIPANSTLYFMIDCLNYEKGEPAAVAGPDPEPVTDPPAGEGGGETGGGETGGGGG